MAYNFLRCDRGRPLLLPPNLRDWLPDGHPAYHPKTLLGVLLYADATGVRSSRQILLELRFQWTMDEEEHDADPVVGSTSPGRWPRCPRVSAPQDRLREQQLAHPAEMVQGAGPAVPAEAPAPCLPDVEMLRVQEVRGG